MALTFTPAVKHKSWLRLALYGPTGGGKTYSGLGIALALAGGDPEMVAVADSEHGSALKYADKFGGFAHVSLPDFTVEHYLEVVHLAVTSGKKALLIDSFSHAWEGEGGILDRQTTLTEQNKGDSQTGWNKVKPFEKKLWNGVLAAPIHLIVTMRSRNEWRQYEEGGKKKREIVGLEPVQRKGSEYEFDVVAFMQPTDEGVSFTVEKTRYPDELPRGATTAFITGSPDNFKTVTDLIIKAVSEGEPPDEATDEQIRILVDLLAAEGKDKKRVSDVIEGERSRNNGNLPAAFVKKAIEQALRRAEKAAAETTPTTTEAKDEQREPAESVPDPASGTGADSGGGDEPSGGDPAGEGSGASSGTGPTGTTNPNE